MKDYFTEQVTRAGRAEVKLYGLPLSKVLAQGNDSKELSVVTISSHLDAVVSAATNLSRDQVKKITVDGEAKLSRHFVA